MPDAAIGADVMAGFPGETDAEFEESRAFIESLPFTYLHVFTYSERPGTPAAERPDQVPDGSAQGAQPDSAGAGGAKESGISPSMIGRTLSVVTLAEGALSDNFLKVELAATRAANQMLDVKIGSLSATGLREHSALRFCNRSRGARTLRATFTLV